MNLPLLSLMWVVVYPPFFAEPQPSPDGTMPDLGLLEVASSDSDGNGEYVGMYEDFTEDGEGDLSQPGVLEVRTR